MAQITLQLVKEKEKVGCQAAFVVHLVFHYQKIPSWERVHIPPGDMLLVPGRVRSSFYSILVPPPTLHHHQRLNMVSLPSRKR